MRFVSVSELKNGTSSIVRHVTGGRPVVVMKHGKPCAAVVRISEDDLDQLLFEESPFVKQAVQDALDDLRRKRYVTLKDYLRGKRSS
jgi:prevent-host-death family protein